MRQSSLDGVHRLGCRRPRCAIRAVIRSEAADGSALDTERAARNEPGSKRLAVGEAIEPDAVATLWQPRRLYVSTLCFARAPLPVS